MAGTEDPAQPDSEEPQSPNDRDELEAQVELLTEENRRLREDYVRARRSRYRRTAIALAVVGLIAVGSGLVFLDSQAVLFALGGTGIFVGVLTWYLTPEQFVAASVGERVYAAFAETGTALTTELGLQDTHIYIPWDETAGSAATQVRLFIPQQAEYDLPAATDLDSVFVITDQETERGVALYPTGGPLFREFERALADDLRASPSTLADQLVDGLVEQFELVETTTSEIDADHDQVVIGVSGSVYGSADRFDHPIASFLGVGFAVGLDRPITVEAETVEGDRADVLVTCSWSVTEG
jgi:hypothetical protein